MAKLVKVRATKKGFGGSPPGRRRPGEVFFLPAGPDGKAPKDSWFEPVDDKTPIARPEPEKPQVPEYIKVKGEYVPAIDGGISGGVQPKADTGDDLV